MVMKLMMMLESLKIVPLKTSAGRILPFWHGRAACCGFPAILRCDSWFYCTVTLIVNGRETWFWLP
jgi:hypothetical protein